MSHTSVGLRRPGVFEEARPPAGLLVDPTDEGEIRAALVRLMADPAERARLGAAGREYARRFSWATAARQTMALFQEAAAARPRPRPRGRPRQSGRVQP